MTVAKCTEMIDGMISACVGVMGLISPNTICILVF